MEHPIPSAFAIFFLFQIPFPKANNTPQVYISVATPTDCYRIGIEGVLVVLSIFRDTLPMRLTPGLWG